MQKAASYTSAIKTFLESNEEDMFALLKELVCIQSGSHNKKGVDKTLQCIDTALKDMSIQTEIIEQNMLGNHMLARSTCPSDDQDQILMVGHMDTVFPMDTDFNWYREDDENCYGPGVVDMKGGLIVGIFALKALQHIGLLSEIPITFLFNSDEEIGSRTSLDIIQKEANQSALALVLECGGLNGEIVTGRKGNLMVELHVEGRAGHAAFANKDKSSAILEMSHKIIALESLNDFKKGVTINVGKVEGGIGPNTVSELSTAQIDFRYIEPDDLKLLENRVTDITEESVVKGIHSSIDFISGRPPMLQCPVNQKLFSITESVAKTLQINVKEEFRFGGSDANFIADLGIPVLDGLGPAGGKDHSDKEYLVKDSLLQRTVLLACTILACWEVRKDLPK